MAKLVVCRCSFIAAMVLVVVLQHQPLGSAAPMGKQSPGGVAVDHDEDNATAPILAVTSAEIGITPATRPAADGHQQAGPITSASGNWEGQQTEEMVTPAALMELLPYEQQQQQQKQKEQQLLLERLRLENERLLWSQREPVRLPARDRDDDDDTTGPPAAEKQTANGDDAVSQLPVPVTTIRPATATTTAGPKKRPENPILKKFKISNSRGIMVFRALTTSTSTTSTSTTTTSTTSTSSTSTTTTEPPTTILSTAVPTVAATPITREIPVTTQFYTPQTVGEGTSSIGPTSDVETAATVPEAEPTPTPTMASSTLSAEEIVPAVLGQTTSEEIQSAEVNTTESERSLLMTTASESASTTTVASDEATKLQEGENPMSTEGSPSIMDEQNDQPMLETDDSVQPWGEQTKEALVAHAWHHIDGRLPHEAAIIETSDAMRSWLEKSKQELVDSVMRRIDSKQSAAPPAVDPNDSMRSWLERTKQELVESVLKRLNLQQQQQQHSTTRPTQLTSLDSKQPVLEHMPQRIDYRQYNTKLLEDAHRVTKQRDPMHDGGHDGVKQTKKKQLIEAHFMPEDMEVDMGEVNGGEVVPKVSVTESTPELARTQNATEKSSALMPVHNGFLGPILMEQKRIGAVHKEKPQFHEHGASIATQLREGRIVEIIAPTALLEDTTGQRREEPDITTAAPFAVAAEQTAPQNPVLSTTVFQVPEGQTSTTLLPITKNYERDIEDGAMRSTQSEQTESKISDIQIEVYDSTVDTIVGATNFKDTDGYYSHPLEATTGNTKSPMSSVTQERFTQYVVDRTDSSTQESNIVPLDIGSGKPEPAAIEIHINVSEGVGNESEDLEFSYRQSDYNDSPRPNLAIKNSVPMSLKPFLGSSSSRHNETAERGGGEHSDEILVVEIIDTGENNTDQSSSAENINPVFTFRSGLDTEEDLKPEGAAKPLRTDELFLADVKKELGGGFMHPPPPPPPPPRKPSIDRDSDTIFYISNTEVKVGESLPTTNSNYEQQQRNAKLESQFFPLNYVASTDANAVNAVKGDSEPSVNQRRYEEDIILSPLRNTADALKIFRTQPDGAPPLDVTYVGESIMEVEQVPPLSLTTTPAAAQQQQQQQQQPDVIIQPAILPEMAIGVPVIGELPPQIELKEIDFMPDEANRLRPGVYDNNSNNIEENNINDSNDVEQLVESSIQYGGDLIDLGAGSSFDGVDGSFPFGNPVGMHPKSDGNGNADYAHYALNHGVSHLRKDELGVEVPASGETTDAGGDNDTLKDESMAANGNETSTSMSAAVAERRMNASSTDAWEMPSTTTVVHSRKMDNGKDEKEDEEWQNTVGLVIGLFFVLTPVVVTVSMACALRYLYYKYHRNSPDSTEVNENIEENHHPNEPNGHTGESTQPPSPSLTDTEKDNTANQNNNRTEQSNKPSNLSTLETIDEKSNDAQTDNSKSDKSNTDSIQTLGRTEQSEPVQHNSVHGYRNGPNGSVTKMTLKNNHLIVETEERNDISRDARETKMHYNGNDKDGIFVVEVSRGIDSKAIPESPISEPNEHRFPGLECQTKSAPLKVDNDRIVKKHQQVEVHPPPPEVQSLSTSDDLQRSLHQIEEVEEPIASPNATADRLRHAEAVQLVRNSNTGLSQSDLSSSSSIDSNKRYSYGNQQLYIIEQHGYETTLPSDYVAPAMSAMSERQQDDDHKSENGHSLEYSPSQSNNNSATEKNRSELHRRGDTEKPTSDQQKERLAKQVVVNNEETTATDNMTPIDVEDEVVVIETETEVNEQLAEVSAVDLEDLCIAANEILDEIASIEREAAENIPDMDIIKSMIPQLAPDLVLDLNGVDDQISGRQLELEGAEIDLNAEQEAQNDDEFQVEIEVETDIQIEIVVEPESETETAANTEAEIEAEITVETEGEIEAMTEAGIDAESEMDVETEAGTEAETEAETEADAETAAEIEAETEAENALDSIMSLPDPPSTEEIKQFNEDSLMDVNQLDSLPPPPPPLSAGNDEAAMDGCDIALDDVEPIQPLSNFVGPTPSLTENDSPDTGKLNGHLESSYMDESSEVPPPTASAVPSPPSPTATAAPTAAPTPAPIKATETEVAMGKLAPRNGEIMSAAPLTPPASPPPPPKMGHYSNGGMNGGINGGLLCAALPVAVDVNGS